MSNEATRPNSTRPRPWHIRGRGRDQLQRGRGRGRNFRPRGGQHEDLTSLQKILIFCNWRNILCCVSLNLSTERTTEFLTFIFTFLYSVKCGHKENTVLPSACFCLFVKTSKKLKTKNGSLLWIKQQKTKQLPGHVTCLVTWPQACTE